MRLFSQILKRVTSGFATTQEFADACGLSQSTVWRLLNDKVLPDSSTLERLCQFLPDSESADLLVAYVLDQIPENLRSIVQISPAQIDSAQLDDYAQIIASLPKHVRDALLAIARECREDADFAQFILDFSKQVTRAQAPSSDTQDNRVPRARARATARVRITRA